MAGEQKRWRAVMAVAKVLREIQCRLSKLNVSSPSINSCVDIDFREEKMARLSIRQMYRSLGEIRRD